jgi:hypothetical protein
MKTYRHHNKAWYGKYLKARIFSLGYDDREIEIEWILIHGHPTPRLIIYPDSLGVVGDFLDVLGKINRETTEDELAETLNGLGYEDATAYDVGRI